jgi:hypothetical protein
MRLIRFAALLAGVLAATALGCGKKGHSKAGHDAEARTVRGEPTPDFTPIAVLRTPAGWLLLKTEHPAATPTPAASAASNPKP